MAKRKYIVKIRYEFNGHYIVRAESADEARDNIEKDCGLVLGGSIHTNLDDEDIDWDFEVHPKIVISSVKLKNPRRKQIKK